MDRRLSRPARWRDAGNRAHRSMLELRELHSEWRTKLERLLEELDALRDQAVTKSEDLDAALDDLINLQREYDGWSLSVPENLGDSRQKQKLDAVDSLSFTRLRKSKEDLITFALQNELERVLRRFDDIVDEAFEELAATLNDARQCDLPKGYGND